MAKPNQFFVCFKIIRCHATNDAVLKLFKAFKNEIYLILLKVLTNEG